MQQQKQRKKMKTRNELQVATCLFGMKPLKTMKKHMLFCVQKKKDFHVMSFTNSPIPPGAMPIVPLHAHAYKTRPYKNLLGCSSEIIINV